ncbi:MAG TPA: NAD(P)-binding domain-containing protein [Thermomicrobiales bacterium]
MTRVAILGAGDMGTGLTTPAAQNGHEVRLWGTELDGAIVSALRAGQNHPRLRVPVASSVRVFAEEEAKEALSGAELVVVAVTSNAVRKIVTRVGPLLQQAQVLMTVAKGFDEDAARTVQLLPDVIAEVYSGPIVAVGGPSKANEVAMGLPTSVVYAGPPDAVAVCQSVFATPTYHIEATDDVVGVEVAAAMKNAYAIAMGVADGLERRTGRPYNNLRSALFPQAVRELVALAEGLGGRRESVLGLAGIGDLQVTLTAGRNRLLGERLGLGERPDVAFAELTSQGTTVEGYLATDFGYRLAREMVGIDGEVAARFPLLDALWAILYQHASPLERLWSVACGAGIEASA